MLMEDRYLFCKNRLWRSCACIGNDLHHLPRKLVGVVPGAGERPSSTMDRVMSIRIIISLIGNYRPFIRTTYNHKLTQHY